MLHHHRRRVNVIYRHVEIALNLRRMQVQQQRPARARRFQQVRDELRGNRHSRLILAILPRVAVIRNHGSDAPSRRALERIDHQQQFHQMKIRRLRTRLHDENIRAAHVLQNLKINLAIAELAQHRAAALHSQIAANLVRQGSVRGSRENLELIVGDGNEFPRRPGHAGHGSILPEIKSRR